MTVFWYICERCKHRWVNRGTIDCPHCRFGKIQLELIDRFEEDR